MVVAYSPHRDGGGTLHLPSPTHIQHADPSSAIAQLRRSMSRSPSKAPSFRILTSKSTSSSPSSPLSPSPLSPSRRANTVPLASPLGVPVPASAKKSRSAIRRSSPMRTQAHLLRSPAKRVLSESSDNGNSTPLPSLGLLAGAEKISDDMEVTQTEQNSQTSQSVGSADGLLNPNSMFARRENSEYLSDIAAKSSPLKRSDGSRCFDSGHGGNPSAKRRSLHGASFGPDFNIFDQAAAFDSQSGPVTEPTSYLDPTTGNVSPLPRRSSSLRKTTLQQRHDKPAVRPRPEFATFPDLNTPSRSKTRTRMSLDNIPQPSHDSPFSSQGALPNASVHPVRKAPAQAGLSGLNQRHPLSRTLTQSSSSSSMAEDSPTHVPIKAPGFRKPSIFSKSLPLGSNRPDSAAPLPEQSSQESGSFSTPDSYKLAKPLPAAFMSTGLISKRNKNLDNAQLDSNEGIGQMPDTPCKRPVSLATMSPFANPKASMHMPRQSRHTMHSFGTPSTPFNPHVSRQNSGLGNGSNIFGSTCTYSHSRRGSFLSDTEENSQPGNIQTQSSTDTDVPPTPTKQVGPIEQSHFGNSYHRSSGSFGFRASVHENEFEKSPSANVNTSPLLDRSGPKSPRTPSETMVPPDPSGLSISARVDPAHRPINFGSSTSTQPPPATPTTNRESFSRFSSFKASTTPVHHAPTAEIDPSMTGRFSKVELIGAGEFSQVFRVSLKANPYGSPSLATSTAEKVWAVKKTRQQYIGPKDRLNKLQEVEMLKRLDKSEHTVQYCDSWESDFRLYIQTEYCEEGSLDLFLDQVGRKARLDDFRIWKIMLELSEGLKHIHDSNIIHLDLKPANVLITFEGTLKIGDFGMATSWPAAPGIEGEGDREYIGPEILMGRFDKPADVFALGLIMLEIAGNVMLPDNGVSWQRLRAGDMTDVPSLTSSSMTSIISRDSAGKPLDDEPSENLHGSDPVTADTDFSDLDFLVSAGEKAQSSRSRAPRAGELQTPPIYMVDPSHNEALDKVVRWMISPGPDNRPVAAELLRTAGVEWVRARRRAGATIYEGNWGPADDVLQDDAEMVDV